MYYYVLKWKEGWKGSRSKTLMAYPIMNYSFSTSFIFVPYYLFFQWRTIPTICISHKSWQWAFYAVWIHKLKQLKMKLKVIFFFLPIVCVVCAWVLICDMCVSDCMWCVHECLCVICIWVLVCSHVYPCICVRVLLCWSFAWLCLFSQETHEFLENVVFSLDSCLLYFTEFMNLFWALGRNCS